MITIPYDYIEKKLFKEYFKSQTILLEEITYILEDDKNEFHRILYSLKYKNNKYYLLDNKKGFSVSLDKHIIKNIEI